MKYRLPGGPPPPLHVNGANTSSAIADPSTARKTRMRHGRARSHEMSHKTRATAPGKKYGTKPKWRPIRKYFVLSVMRLVKSVSTLAESESFVLISIARSHAGGVEPSNGNVV